MKRPALGHILGYTALTVILTAGAAQSLAGSNTVFSDDIADRSVANADLGTNSVSRAKIQDNAIGSSEVLDDSLTGADINESTLAIKKVLFARVRADGGLAGGDATGSSAGSGGSYTVTFGQNVASCAAFANVGAVPGSTITTYYSYASANTGSGNSVTVYLRAPDGSSGGWTYSTSSFTLLVVCP